ncbi:FAD:protein FMN transferase [Parafilimonas terrae]|uniref:FAD:protein FMN transferase n=1 Tax=Parafilimonas terrae TaxID=1465490 RepID=A0A1I5R0X1_9BACT|nr:FAD:protein FMN transferase [Parafilimonas terrae]SFP52142.1 thiamine biosynthesis lipoprotein [Parafilimonas terrae]
MGSPFTITIFATDSAKAAAVAAKAFRLADTLNNILSDYIDSSEINRLSAASGKNSYVRVSQPLFNIIQQAQQAAALSNGAYDITIGPVVKLWRRARKAKTFPDKDSLQSALQKVGYRYIHLDTSKHAVYLEKKGMLLDVGGLGKGFVAQAALNLIKQNGFNSAMVNAGGKIVMADAPDNQKGWLIGINQPEEKTEILLQMLALQNMAVSTSGDIYQYVELNGKKYSHIVNPKTGIGVTHQRNVTVIAPDGTMADWLSTACSILSVKQSLRLIKKIKGAALLITENKNGKIKKKSSVLFKTYYF